METTGNIGKGNTITLPLKRIVPSKYWCFTYFYDDNFDMEPLETVLSKVAEKWIFGLEECPTTKKKHLQGYLEFKFKARPLECKLLKDYVMHWEKRKGTEQKNIDYCSKDGNFKTNIIFPEPLDCVDEQDLYL